MTDQEIVQWHANHGRLDELPPRMYVLTETVVLP